MSVKGREAAARWSHEPPEYDCPFCDLQRGIVNQHNQLGDVVAVTEHAYARISPKWWVGNPGAVLVIPRDHHENLYTIPSAGNQDVWHLHVHVFPRHSDDQLYERGHETRWVDADERAPYAESLASALGASRVFT